MKRVRGIFGQVLFNIHSAIMSNVLFMLSIMSDYRALARLALWPYHQIFLWEGANHRAPMSCGSESMHGLNVKILNIEETRSATHPPAGFGLLCPRVVPLQSQEYACTESHSDGHSAFEDGDE